MNTDNEAFLKGLAQMQRYCDYQDRCSYEVKQRMYSLGINTSWHNDILTSLMENQYLDESRFAKSFVRGKFNNKYWGRIKIKAALRHKRLENATIDEALMSINEEEYIQHISILIKDKIRLMGEIKEAKDKKRLLNYLLQKGYESEEIWRAFKLNNI